MAELAELIERNRRDREEMFPSAETQAQQRGYLAQVPVGLARGLGGALAAVPRALSAIPGVRAYTEPIAEAIDQALPVSSGGYLEGGVESASKSLAVGGMAYAALAGTGGLAAPGVAGFLGSNALRIGAVTGLTFGAGELAESRKRLEGLNTAAVSAGLAPLTDGEIYEIAGTRGLIEGGLESLGSWFIVKRLLSGAVAEGFKGSIGRLLPGIAGQYARESAIIAAEEVPVEMLQAGTQSAIERGVLGEQRTQALEQAGEPVAPPIMTAAGQVATPAGIASAIFGGVRVATSRPMPASGAGPQNAATPTAKTGRADALALSLLGQLRAREAVPGQNQSTARQLDALLRTAEPNDFSPAVQQQLDALKGLTPPATGGTLPTGASGAMGGQEALDVLGQRAVPTQSEIAGIPPAVAPPLQPGSIPNLAAQRTGIVGGGPAQAGPTDQEILLRAGNRAAASVPYALPVGPDQALSSEEIQEQLTGRPAGTLPTALEAGMQRRGAMPVPQGVSTAAPVPSMPPEPVAPTPTPIVPSTAPVPPPGTPTEEATALEMQLDQLREAYRVRLDRDEDPNTLPMRRLSGHIQAYEIQLEQKLRREQPSTSIPPQPPSSLPSDTPQNLPTETPQPGEIRMVAPQDVTIDTEKFQYKRTLAKKGTTGSLADTEKFDVLKAGVAHVWLNPIDSKTYMINGHNRHDLATRSGAPGMNVQYIDAATEADARFKGAMYNIAEGNGTALDAAKFFREEGATPEVLAEEGISLAGAVARDGLALANLNPSLFAAAQRRELSEERGIIIGRELPDHAQQFALLKLLDAQEKRGRRVSNEALRELAQMAREAPTTTTTQDTLFGTEETTQNLAVEKARLMGWLRDRLSKDERLMALVGQQGNADILSQAGNAIDIERSQEAAQEARQLLTLFDRLKHLSGPIRASIDNAVTRIAGGENATKVRTELYAKLGTDLPAALTGALERPTGQLQGGLGEDAGVPSGAATNTTATPDEPSLFGAVPPTAEPGTSPGDSGTVASDVSPAGPLQDAAVPTQGIAEPELGMEAPTEAQDTPWTPYGEAGYAYREVGLDKWEVRTGEGEVLPLRPSSETGAKTRITRLVNEAKGIAALSKGGIPREAIPIVPKKGQLQVLQGNADAGKGPVTLAEAQRAMPQHQLSETPEGYIRIAMPQQNGIVEIRNVAHITPTRAELEVGYGQSELGPGQSVRGRATPMGQGLFVVEITPERTTITFNHELKGHVFEDMGLYDAGDIRAINRDLQRQSREQTAEERANLIAERLNANTDDILRSPLMRVIRKTQQFLDRLARLLGFRSMGQVVRRIQSGAIFQREGSEGTAGAGQLELPAGPARLAPESKVTNPDGTLKVVGHATPESFDFFDPARKGTGAGQMFSGYFFAEDPAVHNRYADEFMAKGKEGVNTRPVYLDIKNPFYLNQEYGVDGRSGAEGQWDTEPLREAIDARFGLGAADFAVEQIERMEGTANVLNSDAYRLFKKYVEDADGKPIGAEGVSQVLEDMGYDGLYHEGKKDGKVWVAFHPDQIIPVLGNTQQRRGRLQVVTNPAQPSLPGIAATTTVSPAVAPVAPSAVPRANPGNVQTEAVPFDHYLFLKGIMTDDELAQGQARAEQGLIPRNRKEVFHDPAMRSASEEKKQDWRDRPQDFQRRLQEVKDGKNAFTSPEFVALAMMAQEQHDLSKAMHAQGILTDARFQEIRDAWSAPNGFLAYAQMAVSEGGRITRLGRYVGEWLGGAHTYAAAMRALDEKLNAIPPDQRDAFKDKLRAAFEANDYNTLQDLASQIPNSSLRERFFEFYYGSILSGFGTQAVNAFSTTASQLFHNSIIRPMAGMADAITAGITGRERRIFASEMLPALLTQFKGMSDVYKHAWWMWTGDTRKGQLLPFFRQETGVGGTEQGTALGAWARASYLEDHPAIGKTAGDPIVWMRKLAPLVTAASRLMAGLDVGMSLNAFDQEVSARARRESLRQKIPRDQQDAFEADYQQTFLSKHPPGVGDKLFEEVSQVMKQQVFHDGTGHLAQALGKLHSIPGIGAFFQLLTPFKSTPDALLRRGLELLPGTPLVNGWYRKNVSWKWGGWLPMVGKEAMNDEAMFMLARQATGILMTASLYAMWHAGRISGPPPEDPAEREAQQRAGIVPYSIKMGDSWYSWRRFEPMSLPLGIMVSAFDAKKRREERMEKRGDVPVGEVYDGLAITAVAVQAGIKYIMDASYFSGLANFLEGTTQGQQSGTGDIPRGLMRQIVSATTPWVGFQRSLINALDASGTVPGTTAGQVTIRQPQGLGQTYAGSLFPFALMEGVGAKPRLSVFGQPLTRQSSTIGELTPVTPPIQRGFNPPDALEDTLRRLKYYPGQPAKVDAVTGKALSPELYRRLQVIRGPIVQAKLEQLVTHTNFDRLDPLDAKKMLQNAVSNATKQAKAQLARETR